MVINDADIKIIPDSRGKDTLEAELKSGDFLVKASVPSGKSVGSHESFVLEPKKAVEKFKEIKPQILAASVEERIESQEKFDNFLIELDGTHSTGSGQAPKSNLGGNLILALSLSFARLKAKSENKELFQYVRNILPNYSRIKTPAPIFNVINGGAHAKNDLDFQEFQVIPQVEDFEIALGFGKEFYKKLENFLVGKFGRKSISVGDEAGFSAPFKNNEEAIEILAELIGRYNYPLRIGIDAAASQFYKMNNESGSMNYGTYIVDAKKYSSEELQGYYLRLVEAYNILSIEDPFYEEDFDSFASLMAELCARPPKTSSFGEVGRGTNADRCGKLVITDDLTTTNPERLKVAINKRAGNAILIKPNQIGTLTETLKVVDFAYQNDWRAVVSHRSGETMDDFIADLAVGISAWGIKAGAPASLERMAKYERAIEILNSKP